MRNEITIKKISKEDWYQLASPAHEAVFNEKWDAGLERIDFALLSVDAENMLIQYATIREMDRDSCFLNYGGSFPKYRGSIHALQSFRAILDWLYSNYKNVSFLTENINWPMLKFAIREKFRVIGVRTFKGHVMLEHYKGRD